MFRVSDVTGTSLGHVDTYGTKDCKEGMPCIEKKQCIQKNKKVKGFVMAENLRTHYETIELRQALKEKDELIEKLMKLDALTELPNWPTTNAYIERCLTERQYPLGLLCIDFDNFRVFNHTYGYLLGDLLLAQFGKKALERLAGDGVLLGRFNGEAFLVVVPGAVPEGMQELVNVLFAVADELTVNLHDSSQVKADLTISVGGVLWNGMDEMTSYALLRQADFTMREAKKAGRNQYVFHQIEQFPDTGQGGRPDDMIQHLASEIRGALKRGEFEPFYQPLYSIQDNVPVSAEALVRWRHPVAGVHRSSKRY